MDISYDTTTFGGIDQRWIGSDHGFETAQPGTVDLTKVTGAIDQFGYLKGGTLLGKVTTGGLLGIYDSTASDGRQTIYGVVTRDEYTKKADGTTLPKIGVGVLRHGVIHQAFLPVAAHRTVTRATASTADLIFD